MNMRFQVGRGLKGLAVILTAATAPLACSDATDVELLEIGGSGAILGRAFIDLDGDGTFGASDSAVADSRVLLLTSTTAETVLDATTDSAGVFAFLDVPVGGYRLGFDPTVVGDSLEIVGSNDAFALSLGDTISVQLGVTFPALAVENVATATPGQRVFTTGITLNSRVNFDPSGQVHLAGSSAFLRALNVERVSLATGDSVRFLGRIVVDNGRPALDDVTATVLIRSAANPAPIELTVGQAASADGGSADAALARIRTVEITDTSTNLDGDFRFWGVSGSDSIEIVLRAFLGLNTTSIRPDTTVRLAQATGLLSPFDTGGGAVRWRLLPRGSGDISLETKTADIRVTAALSQPTATQGDTVEVTVVALNAGPAGATGVAIRDTIPTVMSFVSAIPTSGSYDATPGTWTIGDMAPGQSDTLRLRLEVTGNPGIMDVPIVSESLGLTFEVDPNNINSRAVVTLSVS